MTFHTLFPPKPSHTNHSKYFNCLSWKCRIASPHTSWSWDTQQIPGPSTAPPQPCPITSLPCCSPSGRAQLFLSPPPPHHFWGQILHSTAVFVYRTRSEHGTHTLDPAEFFFWQLLLQTTQHIQPWSPVILGHPVKPRRWAAKVTM